MRGSTEADSHRRECYFLARFGHREDFDFTAQPSINQKLVRELTTGGYLADATNVMFIGPPGVGKTMLAVILGRAAVDTGHRVYYTTAADLAARWAALQAKPKSNRHHRQ